MKNLPPPTSHSLLPIFCLLLTLFLSGCAGLRIKKVTKINPHGEQKYCLECHIKQGSKKLKSRIIRLCRHCHKEVCEAGIHPINIIFKEAIPRELPLEKKRIVCITCHEPCTRTVHGESHGRTEYPKLLRLSPNDLCNRCHQK